MEQGRATEAPGGDKFSFNFSTHWLPCFERLSVCIWHALESSHSDTWLMVPIRSHRHHTVVLRAPKFPHLVVFYFQYTHRHRSHRTRRCSIEQWSVFGVAWVIINQPIGSVLNQHLRSTVNYERGSSRNPCYRKRLKRSILLGASSSPLAPLAQ